MKANWKEGKNKYYQISDCGNYTLSAAKLKNKWIYVLWDVKKKQAQGDFRLQNKQRSLQMVEQNEIFELRRKIIEMYEGNLAPVEIARITHLDFDTVQRIIKRHEENASN